MSHDAFVKAIRANPDDDTARLVFADWYEEHGEPDRAEYVRAACRLARLPLSDPSYPAAQKRTFELYAEHHEAWTDGWPDGLEWSFDRGLLTGVCGPLATITANWKALFDKHPIHRVRVSDQVSGAAKRAAKELAWLPLVDDLRVYWGDPTNHLFDAFKPEALSFRRLWIDGDPNSEQILKLLDGPTRERIESFRYVNCRYTYDTARDRRNHHRVAFHDLLTRLNRAPRLRELGVLLGGQSFGPDDLRSVLVRDFAANLEYLELSAAEPTKACADLLAETDRLPRLRRLDLGIDRSNRLHSLDAILDNPHLANLTSLATEWSGSSDDILTESAFLGRASELQLWRPISARQPRSAVPLETVAELPETLDVAIDSETDNVAAGWAGAPWAPSVHALRLRGHMGGVTRFAAKLARGPGFPNLRSLSLILDATNEPNELDAFVTAARSSAWLRDVLVTCHSNINTDDRPHFAGTIPAATPENPGDIAWYACPPAVGRMRAFHVLPRA